MFSELWPRHQAAGDSLCFPEPNPNKGCALQPSAPAARTDGLPSSRMPCLESQQVAGGMFALLAAARPAEYPVRLWCCSHKHNGDPPGGCRCGARREHQFPQLSLFLFKSNVSFFLPPPLAKRTPNTPGLICKTVYKAYVRFSFQVYNSLAKHWKSFCNQASGGAGSSLNPICWKTHNIIAFCHTHCLNKI